MASVRDFGLGLVRSGHGSAAEIQKAVEQLDDAQRTLHMAWGDRKTLLGQAKDLQVLVVGPACTTGLVGPAGPAGLVGPLTT